MEIFRLLVSSLFILCVLGLQSCNDNDVPLPENEEEVIDKLVLTFTPAGGTALEFIATDPDGEGSANFIMPTLELIANTTYTLTIGIFNNSAGVNITEEIEEEALEHMFFFEFTSELFTSPVGDGNIGAGSRNDAVNYTDEDTDGNPLGLSTVWQTGSANNGTFRILLKHQPGTKSASSSSNDGETDLDLIWDLIIN
jgi:hypothetical protein